MKDLARIASEVVGVPGSVSVEAADNGKATFGVQTSKGRMFIGLHPATGEAARNFGAAALTWLRERQ